MKWWYWLLLLIPRLVCLISSQGLFSRDAVNYLQQAQDMATGDAWRAFSHSYPPLYAFLVSLPIRMGVPIVDAGLIVSLLASLLAGFCFYKIGSRCGGEKVGFLALLLYAFHDKSIYFSVDAISESLYGALMVAGFCCLTLRGAHNSDRKNTCLLITAALSTGLCASTRVEGLFLGFLFVVYLIFVDAGLWKQRLSRAGVFSLFMLVGMGPYIWIMHVVSGGEWHLSVKYNLWSYMGVADFLGYHYTSSGDVYDWVDPLKRTSEGLSQLRFEDQPRVEEAMTLSRVIGDFLSGFFKLLGSVTVLLALAFYRPVRMALKNKFMILFVMGFILFVTLAGLQFFQRNYISHRHFYGCALCLIPVMALGWQSMRWGSWKKPAVLLLIVFVSFGLLRSVRSPHRKKGSLREIGFICRSYEAENIMCADPRLAFFAEKTIIKLPGMEYDFKRYVTHRMKFIRLAVVKDAKQQAILKELGYIEKEEFIFLAPEAAP
jgi:4-amino-4-deoxy-L-arabinose transferase-like glycosyltransferase